MKDNCARIRRENPGLGLGEVMRKLGEEFREVKRKAEAQEGERTILGEKIESTGDDHISDINDEHESNHNRDPGTDEMVRKLDFLNLG